MLKTAFKVILLLTLIVLVGSAYYIHKLDSQIVDHFEGKRWKVPAKIYSRPLTLFDGKALSLKQLEFELKQLGYIEVEGEVEDKGSYHISGSNISIHTKGFTFADSNEVAQVIDLSLRGDEVSQLTAAGQATRLVRIEPLIIGGIYPDHKEDRVLVPLSQVPDSLAKGFVTVEDKNFYKHNGLSIKGIVRALKVNLSEGGLKQGGSTLTQQLVKNFYLSRDKTFRRKFKEAIMAVLLDMRYEKDEILQAYLNEIYFGQSGNTQIHGVGLASLFYFGKPVSELNVSEQALLIGMVKAPSTYNPRNKPEKAKVRRNLVLKLMYDNDVIGPEVFQVAKKSPVKTIKKPIYNDNLYPAFIDLIKEQLKRDYNENDLKQEGLLIVTTLDPWVQYQLEAVITSELKGKKDIQVAAMITEPSSSKVLAAVGDKVPKYSGFNRLLNAKRPAGSLIKPALYLTALKSKDYRLSTLIPDVAMIHELPDGSFWEPKNYDNIFHGQVPLIEALVNSYNVAAAALVLELGVDNLVKTLNKLGVEPKDHVPALALGAVDFTVIDAVVMYQVFANQGFKVPLTGVSSVMTHHHKGLKSYPLDVEQVFAEKDIYLLNHALEQVVQKGTAKGAAKYFKPKSAGKTGTSNDYKDSWYVGFTGNYLGAIWLGNDDNQSINLTGSKGALPIWAKVMAKLAQKDFVQEKPDSIVEQWVFLRQDEGAKAHCPGAVKLPIKRETAYKDLKSCRFMDRVKTFFKIN